MVEKKLSLMLREASDSLDEVKAAWLVRQKHRESIEDVQRLAQGMLSENAILTSTLERKTKDFAKVDEWRQTVEASRKEASEAKTAKQRLERRVVQLEKEVAALQNTDDKVKSLQKTLDASHRYAEEQCRLYCQADEKLRVAVAELSDTKLKLQETYTAMSQTQANLVESNSKLNLLEIDFDVLLTRLNNQTTQLENGQAKSKLLQERLDAIDLHAVAIHGIVVDKAMSENAEETP